MDIIYYNEQDVRPFSFCVQTRIIAQVTANGIRSRMLKKEESSLLLLLLTTGLLTYQEAEEATQATIEDVRHVIIPSLSIELAPFLLTIGAVPSTGFTLFHLPNVQ